MAIFQTGQPRQHFEKKEGKKGHDYCPIHRTDAHDLTKCKVIRGIIDKELGEHKYRHDKDGEDRANLDQSALRY